jgi:phenylacetate-CoA ligase
MTTLCDLDAMGYSGMPRDFGRPADVGTRIARLSRGELRALQAARLASLKRCACKVSACRCNRGAVGIARGDIRGLDHFCRPPPHGKSDLMAAVKAHPPVGDFHGLGACPTGRARR